MSSYKSITLEGATIAHGNNKLQQVPNVSLLPIASCPPSVPCARQCYDVKACKMYRSVRDARQRNWRAARTKRNEYFNGIRQYLERYAPNYFRWHVGGDIPDQDYLRRMFGVAREFPNTRFLVFTKRHNLTFRRRPDNLNIVLSMWPSWGNSRKRMPRAWMQDGTETRIPDNAIQCSGDCEHCGICWHLRAGQDVWFKKH